MVSIYKRGARLYLQYTVEGKRQQKSTGLEDTPINRKLLKQKVIPALETKIASGELQKKPPKLFNIFAEKYIISKDKNKTALEIAKKVHRIQKKFGHREINDIKRAEVKEFAHTLLDTVTPKTVRNYLGVMRGIFQIAIEWDELDNNPADHIKLPQHHKKDVEPFTPEEVGQLIDAADGWLKNFLAIGFYTGMRTGEIIGLMQGDIDLDTMEIKISRGISRGIVETPKTNSGIRTVPIFESLLPYLGEQTKVKTLYLFTGEDGKHLYGSDSLKRKWRKVCDTSGIQYRKLYSTRHTFITTMLKSGKVSILELAQMVGHANSEPIIRNYARFIEGEHLKIEREFDLFSVTNQPTVNERLRCIGGGDGN